MEKMKAEPVALPVSLVNWLTIFPRINLLTTRNKKLGVKFTAAGGVITIPKMNVSESKRLLVGKLEEDDHDDNALIELVETLENLPLALVQAAAFIRENSQSIGEYLQTYRGSDSSKTKLLSQDFADIERHPDSKNPVAVTWAISFEQIRKNDHRAAELLSLMSVLDRQAIPKSLLTPEMEEVELERALGTLKAFSLITPEHSRQAFNLHRLVYLATRNWMNRNGELDSWTRKALVLLSDRFPFAKFENQEIWMPYLPHARIVLNSNHLPASENIAQATLLYKVSNALQQKGDYDSAETMAQKSFDLRKEVLGKNHVDTLRSLSSIRSVLWRQGKNEKADKVFRQALNDFEEILGKEDLDTLACLSRLALVLTDQGKYEEAEDLHRQALSDYEKTLGIENHHTLVSVSHLARVLHYQGKYEAAKKLDRRALSAQEKILGKKHPHTLVSVNNLAVVLHKQGNNEAAEKLYRRALSAQEKILGKKHSHTLVSVNNLAAVLHKQGNNEAAEKLYRRALRDSEKVLGKEHPLTLTSVNNLARVLREQGQVEEALILYQRALSGREKRLGKEHPKTFESICDLARYFHTQYQYQHALPLYETACVGLEKTLGSNHPKTQFCVQNYSIMLAKMKRLERDSETGSASVDNADS